jgi:hypothetical protein
MEHGRLAAIPWPTSSGEGIDYCDPVRILPSRRLCLMRRLLHLFPGEVAAKQRERRERFPTFERPHSENTKAPLPTLSLDKERGRKASQPATQSSPVEVTTR